MGMYQCRHCGKITQRDSNKKQIKSFCSEFNKSVRIVRITNVFKVAEHLRKKHLKNMFDLDSFSKAGKLNLISAFQQGALCALNGLIDETNL